MSEDAVELGEVLVEEFEPGLWVGVQVVGFDREDLVVVAVAFMDVLMTQLPDTGPSPTPYNDGQTALFTGQV